MDLDFIMDIINEEDNTEKFGNEYEKALKRALKAIGMTAEKYAKQDTPVDTGLLRNSITFALSGESPNISTYQDNKGEQTGSYMGTTAPNDFEQSVYIGTNVEYGSYVENGSMNRRAVHMLRKAATEHTPEYQRIMQDSVKNE